MLFKVAQLESLCPTLLVQVHEHALFRLGLLIVDRETWSGISSVFYKHSIRTVVIPVQTVDQSLDARLVQVTNVARSLPRLLTHHE
jgi:uncharacterized protein YunC (DUF1805 family)